VFTVVVTDDRYNGNYRDEEAELAKVDARLVVQNLGSEEEARRALATADGVLVNLFPLGERVIQSLQRCRVISRYGVGYDNVDVGAATRKGIWVTRVPDYSLEEVSDQALALLMACVRKVAYKDRGIRAGKWNIHKDQPTHRVVGGTMGLVGYGAIARCFHRKIAGLGFGRILVHDPYVRPEVLKTAGCVPADLRTLVSQSDFISVHVPLSPDTRGMIGAHEIAAMKKGAILVNTSRGPVVDEKALAAGLREGRLAGAGLDVFEVEPLPLDSPLRALENVVLSDHAGWYSEESITELKIKAARNVAAVLSGGRPIYPVNDVVPAGP